MKRFKVTISVFFCFLMGTSFGIAASAAFPAEYKDLLKKYVREEGVRYAAWSKNAAARKKLDKVVNFYAEGSPPRERNEALAWYLNAYNVWILKKMVEAYPVKGPLAGNPLFFKKKSIKISGKKRSFDFLEQKIIRKEFKEPRIHFAVNCASRGCPPLAKEAFEGKKLNAQLDYLTKKFIQKNPLGVSYKKGGQKVYLSKIFEWYADDFGGKKALISYVNRYSKIPVAPTAKVEFMKYDWSLNASR